MKANEAPEKMYISSEQKTDKEIFYGTCTKVEDNDIEYTRTDAFIDKACEWLRVNLCDYFDAPREDYDMCLDDLKQAIKDE